MSIRTKLMGSYLMMALLVAVAGFFGWFTAREMVGSFERGEERVRAVVASATALSFNAKRLQGRLIWYLIFHEAASKQRLFEISGEVKQNLADLESTVEAPEAKGILKKAEGEADALLVSIGHLIEVHDREYADTSTFDVSQHAASFVEVSQYSSKLRSHGVDLAQIATDYLNRQEAIIAATRSISFAERAEGHVLLYLILGDERDRDKFYQRIASMDQQIGVLQGRVVLPEGAQLVRELKQHAKDLSLAGKALIEAYDHNLRTKSRFILQNQRELIRDLRAATRQIDAIGMNLAKLNLELETKPKAIAMTRATNLQRNVLLVALAAVLGALALGYWISRGIFRPIVELTSAAREIGKGNLATKLEVRASNEIGELIDTFNRMSEDLLRTTVSKDYVANIVGGMAEALIVTSADGLIKRVNKAAADLLGYAEDELLEKPLGLVVPGDEAEDSLPREAHEPVSCAKGEITLLSKSGQHIPVICSISQFTDSDGSVQGMVLTAQDISDLKRTEERLKESDSQKQAILDGIATNIAFVNENLEILWVNKAAADSVAKLPSQMVGHKCHQFWADPGRPCDGCPTLRAFRTKRSEQSTVVTPDGRVWDEKGEPVFDADGRLLGVVEIALDITARMKAEEVLRESEARYRYLVENIEDLICTHDLEGNLLFVSPGPARKLGTTAAAMVGTNLRSYLAPEVRDQFDAYLATIRKDGRASGFMLVQRSNGEKRLWEYHNTLHSEKGAEPIVLGLARDVTERTRAEQVERRLATAIDQATEGVLITNTEGTIQYVNPGLERMTGYRRDELLGQTPRILKSGEHDTAFYQQLWNTIKAGNTWSGRLTNRRKDGRLYHEDTTITPVKDASGKIMNFVAVKRDITEHLDLSRQLLQAQKMEAVGTLAGGVAHDFNNILQVALGYSELLLGDEELPGNYRADLQKILESAKRGADLVQRLLTFSRKTEIKPQPLNLNRRITELRKMLERTIPKMIDIQLFLGENLATINVDPTQMDQILMNLAVNARDAMPEGGKLIVETANTILDEEYTRTHFDAKPGPHVLLTITDTGSGMGKDTLEHVFEPFYTTKAVGAGTGLGLAMVHGIVKQHGGHVTCNSELGRGTTFKIYFPALVSHEDIGETTVSPMPRGGSETILLVDDEEFIRDLGSRILTHAGYTVITAPNGKEAVEVYPARRNEIALVMLDLIMPEMGGKQCLEGLLNLNPSVKVVIASGYSANDPTMVALAKQAKGFVNKPYNIRQVLQVVRDALDAE
jgi:PAS domain S-box-containing protein